jgi:2-desacetyl-2-hydroxyethyl bacteriochlorophyllide A dehydrogenase
MTIADAHRRRLGGSIVATAMRLTAQRRFEPVEAPLSDPADGEVLVRIAGCGVCASNVPPWEGREWFTYPMAPGAPGHEGWGEVIAAGPGVRGLAVGDAVGFLHEQAFASHAVVPVARCVRLPGGAAKGGAAGRPFPAEPLACAMNVAARAEMKAGQIVAVVGIGFLGSLFIRLAAAEGARVAAVARRESSLQRARAAGAAVTVLAGNAEEATSAVAERFDGRLCDCVIECAGSQAALDIASELVRVRGRLVVAGYHQDGDRRVNMQSWNWRGIDVINAHERDEAIYMRGMRRAVQAVEQGILDPEPLCTHRFAMTDLNEAMEMASVRPDGFIKALVVNE